MADLPFIARFMHVAVRVGDLTVEADCPCGKAPCGLVDGARIAPACPAHSGGTLSELHEAHSPDACPAPKPVTEPAETAEDETAA